MPSLLGKVNINKCMTNNWIPKIRGELQKRRIEFQMTLGLKKLKELLLKNEHQHQLPVVSGSNPKWFAPQELPPEDWETWD